MVLWVVMEMGHFLMSVILQLIGKHCLVEILINSLITFSVCISTQETPELSLNKSTTTHDVFLLLL